MTDEAKTEAQKELDRLLAEACSIVLELAKGYLCATLNEQRLLELDAIAWKNKWNTINKRMLP